MITLEELDKEYKRIIESIVEIRNIQRASDENNKIVFADLHDRLKALEKK